MNAAVCIPQPTQSPAFLADRNRRKQRAVAVAYVLPLPTEIAKGDRRLQPGKPGGRPYRAKRLGIRIAEQVPIMNLGCCFGHYSHLQTVALRLSLATAVVDPV